MAGSLIGYARCSTDQQDLTAQRDRLHELGVPTDRIYLDHGLIGTNRQRPGLGQALAAVRTGDTLVVPKLDRLARSVPDVRAIGDDLAARGIKLSLGGQLYDPTDPMGKMFFNILATFAELKSTSCASGHGRAWPWPGRKGACGGGNRNSHPNSEPSCAPEGRTTARRGEKLREHILRAAKDVFLEMGFERASMDVLAARVATSKRTLYAHFESKDKLFLAVVDLVRELYLDKLKTPDDYGGDTAEAVVLFCDSSAPSSASKNSSTSGQTKRQSPPISTSPRSARPSPRSCRPRRSARTSRTWRSQRDRAPAMRGARAPSPGVSPTCPQPDRSRGGGGLVSNRDQGPRWGDGRGPGLACCPSSLTPDSWAVLVEW
jgi:AcrR family transcriptional regulator